MKKAICLLLMGLMLLSFTACGEEKELETVSFTESGSESETEIVTESESESETETAPEEEDLSVEGWLASHADMEKGEALMALLEARSEAAKDATLGEWKPEGIATIKTEEKEVTLDEETSAALAGYFAKENLKAVVMVPEIIKAYGDDFASSSFGADCGIYDGWNGGDEATITFESGEKLTILYDVPEGMTQIWMKEGAKELPFLWAMSYKAPRKAAEIVNIALGGDE